MTDISRKTLLSKFNPNQTVQYDIGIQGVKEAYSENEKLSWTTINRDKNKNFFRGKKSKDIFFFSMCAGYNYNQYLEFTKKENKQGQIAINAFTEDELWTMLAIGMDMIFRKEQHVSTKFIGEEHMTSILDECMKYANGGMSILQNFLNKGNANENQGFEDELKRLIDED